LRSDPIIKYVLLVFGILFSRAIVVIKICIRITGSKGSDGNIIYSV